MKKYKFELTEIVENNAKEGYATALINHKDNEIKVYATGEETNEMFNNDIFDATSKGGYLKTQIHNSDNSREFFTKTYPTYTII